MGSGFSKMKKQAKLLGQQFNKIQEDLQNQRFEGSAGNGLVRVTLSGEKKLLKVSLKPECVDPSDIEALEDLIQAAFQDASAKIEAANQSEQMGLPAGLSLPF